MVSIKYFNKTEKREKIETITVMEFIARIIRHSAPSKAWHQLIR